MLRATSIVLSRSRASLALAHPLLASYAPGLIRNVSATEWLGNHQLSPFNPWLTPKTLPR